VVAFTPSSSGSPNASTPSVIATRVAASDGSRLAGAAPTFVRHSAQAALSCA
jgi:hypothetical protein